MRDFAQAVKAKLEEGQVRITNTRELEPARLFEIELGGISSLVDELDNKVAYAFNRRFIVKILKSQKEVDERFPKNIFEHGEMRFDDFDLPKLLFCRFRRSCQS